MSKFYEAMERSADRAAKPAPAQVEEIEELDALSETLYEVETEEPVSPLDPLGESEDKGLSDRRVDTVGFEATEAPSPVREPVESGLAEEPIHPAYERIIQKLLAFRSTPRQGVILVVGAVPGEGASTIARNTALSLRRGQAEQVVLVDANIRAPSQHTAFQTELSNGLIDVLKGPASLTSAVRTDVVPGLSLLTAGRPIESPLNLLTISALQGVVMALTSFFDWVIIDGPPVTIYPESASLAAASGGALLVVRAERTRQEVAIEAKRVLDDSGTDVLGAVLNRRRYYIPDFIYRRL
jgi:capsular exopolysaccharide synthesis family protein